MPDPRPYRGRFAPSPTGPLHAGSLVAALASWLDARAHLGAWLVRIEDLDPPREQPGSARAILAALAALGIESDEPVLWQHERLPLYARALGQLAREGHVYACECSRTMVAADSVRLGLPAGVYAGTCRERALADTGGRAVRLRVPDARVSFVDRAAGAFAQDLAREAGDFVIRRGDGPYAYQIAVVVDDAEQAITHVVRGADLLDNTPRQIVLQQLLGLSTPRYLHVPVVRGRDGEKLSKQNGAEALDLTRPLLEFERAGQHLGMPRVGAASIAAFLRIATEWWCERWRLAPTMTAKQERSRDG